MLPSEKQIAIGVIFMSVIVVRTLTAAALVDKSIKSNPKTTTSLLPLQPPLNVRSTTTTSVFGDFNEAVIVEGEHSSVNSDNSDGMRSDVTTNNQTVTTKPSKTVPDIANDSVTKNEGYMRFDVDEVKNLETARASRSETVKEVLSDLFPNGFSDIFRFSYAVEPSETAEALEDKHHHETDLKPSINHESEQGIPLRSQEKERSVHHPIDISIGSQKITQDVKLKLPITESDDSSAKPSETIKRNGSQDQKLYPEFMPNNSAQETAMFKNLKPQPFQYPEMIIENINSSEETYNSPNFRPTETPRNHTLNNSHFNLATQLLKSEIEASKQFNNKSFYSIDTNISKEYRRQLSPGHMEIIIEKVYYPKEKGSEFLDGLNTISKETLLRINRAAEHASVLPSLLVEPLQENGTAEETILSMNGPIVILKDDSEELIDDTDDTAEDDNAIAESQHVSHQTYKNLLKNISGMTSENSSKELPSVENKQILEDAGSTLRALIPLDSDLPINEGKEGYTRKRQTFIPRDLDNFQEHAERTFSHRNAVQEAPSRKFLKNFSPALTNSGKIPIHKGGFHYEINSPASPLLPKNSMQQLRPQADYSPNSVKPVSNILPADSKDASTSQRAQQSRRTEIPFDFSYQYFTVNSVTPKPTFFVTMSPRPQTANEYQTPHEYVSKAAKTLKENRIPSSRPATGGSYTFVEVQKSINLHNKLIKEQDGQLLEQQETTYYRPQYAKDITASATPSPSKPAGNSMSQKAINYLPLATHPINVQQHEAGYQEEIYPPYPPQKVMVMQEQSSPYSQKDSNAPTSSQKANMQVMSMQNLGNAYNYGGPKTPPSYPSSDMREMSMTGRGYAYDKRGPNALGPSQTPDKQSMHMGGLGHAYNQQVPNAIFPYQKADQQVTDISGQANSYNQQGSTAPFSTQKSDMQIKGNQQDNSYQQGPNAPISSQKVNMQVMSMQNQGSAYSYGGPNIPFPYRGSDKRVMILPGYGNAYNQQSPNVPLHSQTSDNEASNMAGLGHAYNQQGPNANFPSHKTSQNVVDTSGNPYNQQDPNTPIFSQKANMQVMSMQNQGNAYNYKDPNTPFPYQSSDKQVMSAPGQGHVYNQQGPNSPLHSQKSDSQVMGYAYNQQGLNAVSLSQKTGQTVMGISVQNNSYNQQGSTELFPPQKFDMQVMSMKGQGNNYNQQGPTAPSPSQKADTQIMAMQGQGSPYNQEQQAQELRKPTQHDEANGMFLPQGNFLNQPEEEQINRPSALPLQQMSPQAPVDTEEIQGNNEEVNQHINQVSYHGPEQYTAIEQIIDRPLGVDRYIDRPYPVPEIVERHIPMPYPVVEPVGVPIHIDRYIDRPYPVETIVEKPVPYAVEKVIEKVVEKHVPIEVSKVVEKPVEKIVERIVDRPVAVPIRVPVGIPVTMHGHYAFAQAKPQLESLPYPHHQQPSALSWPEQYGPPQPHYRPAAVINLPEKVLKKYYVHMLKKLLPKANSAQKAAFTAASNIISSVPASRPNTPLLHVTKPPVKILDIRFDLKPPPPSSASWNQGARYIYNTLPSDLTAASAASGPADETPDTSRRNYRDEILRWRNGQSLKRSPDFGRNLRVEYGFKPPLVPSIEIDDQGIPLKPDTHETAN